MGSFCFAKTANRQGRKPGKIAAPLNKKLAGVEWGEYRLTNIFDIKNTKNIISRDIVFDSGNTPYLCASCNNNSVSSYITYDDSYIESGNCIFIGGKTFAVSFQEKDFFSNDSHNLVLYLKDNKYQTKFVYLYLAASIRATLSHKYSWGNSISFQKIQKDKILLPTKNNKPDYEFMEEYIKEIEAYHIKEIEAYHIKEIEAYLTITGLYSQEKITESEKKALDSLSRREYKEFNLQKLFGNSTRGKRLKSSDRIDGCLPFVTAGEVNQGISDFIGNDVNVFKTNTTTIDMFGSAKYRNYDYGADDHIAVVHTENLDKNAAIFVSASIHKSSHNGKYHYGHNFYAKDADNLNIFLPVKENQPDYEFMAKVISAVTKLIVRDVIAYVEKKMALLKNINKGS